MGADLNHDGGGELTFRGMRVVAQTKDGYTIAKRGVGPGGFFVFKGNEKNAKQVGEFGYYTDAVAMVIVERESDLARTAPEPRGGLGR